MKLCASTRCRPRFRRADAALELLQRLRAFRRLQPDGEVDIRAQADEAVAELPRRDGLVQHAAQLVERAAVRATDRARASSRRSGRTRSGSIRAVRLLRRHAAARASCAHVGALPLLELRREVGEPDLLVLGRAVQHGEVVELVVARQLRDEGLALALLARVDHREQVVLPVLVHGALVAVADRGVAGHRLAHRADVVLGHVPHGHAVRAEARLAMPQDRREAPQVAAPLQVLERSSSSSTRQPERGARAPRTDRAPAPGRPAPPARPRCRAPSACASPRLRAARACTAGCELWSISRWPVMSSVTPILNSRSVGSMRVESAPRVAVQRIDVRLQVRARRARRS